MVTQEGRALAAALEPVARRALGDEQATVDDLVRLSGGASRETWSLDLRDGAGRPVALILRRDPPGDVREGGMEREAAAMKAARDAEVAVPAIIAEGDGSDGVGTPYLLMERLEGETVAPRILKRPELETARSRLPRQVGQQLARVHRVEPSPLGLEVERRPRENLVARLDERLELGQAHPALELGVQWLAQHEPPPVAPRTVHGDFRMGNLMVDAAGLVAVLDWELVHAGDPMEDLGWLCVRAWRFGQALPVGGFATRAELFDAYAAESGRDVEPSRVRWWELFGTVNWALMCAEMAERHRRGDQRSVELAAIGRRVAENEWDVLDLIDG